ncbi:MAG: homocysteine S-methyltransferase family protein, partial [Burkholderiales bacterium]
MSSRLLERLKQYVLLCDGAMGTIIQAQVWDVDKDFLGLENCSEILNITRPDFVESVHRRYLEAGADCVETNTFGANKVVFAEFGLVERTYEINRVAAEIARSAAQNFSTRGQPRFVLGSIGPGTKLPSLGHIGYDALEDSYCEQVRGLLDGGVDGLLLETNQDLLTVKAAVNACK